METLLSEEFCVASRDERERGSRVVNSTTKFWIDSAVGMRTGRKREANPYAKNFLLRALGSLGERRSA